MGNKLDISGTGTNNLVFEYVLVADDKGDIPYYRDSASLVLSNNATITVSGTKTPANTTLPAPSSLVSSATQAAPTCSNNPCNTGSVVSITVDFTEAVIVNGVPTLTLSNGQTATYNSGTGTKNIVFTYTMTASDAGVIPNYQNSTSLVLSNNSTINTVASGTPANTTLPTPGDTIPPTISSVSATNENGTYVKDGKVYITITLSETVTVSGVPTLALTTGNASNGYAVYVSGSGSNILTFEYIVRSGDKVADLNYVSTSSLELNGGTVKDAGNNNLSVTLPATSANTSLGGAKDIALDTTPKVASITTNTPNGSYSGGSTINFIVTFTDNVTTSGVVTLALANGKNATCTNVENSATMNCNYSVVQGDTSNDLTYLSTSALGGTVTSAANSNLAAVKTLPDPSEFATGHDIIIADLPSVSFTTGGASSVLENVGGGKYNVNFTLSTTSSTDITFTLSTGTTGSGVGHATFDSDFTSYNETVTIPAGQTTLAVPIGITINDDSNFEGNETFTLTMSGVSTNALLSTTSVQTVTITENDSVPTLSLSSATYSGTEGGTITITINRTGGSDLSAFVTLATGTTGSGPGHAISGTDFTAINQLIEIPASSGNTTITRDIQTTQDTLYENSETLTAAISVGAGANASLSGTTSASVTITDNDTAPTASLTAGTTNSVGEGAGNYTLSVTLSAVAGLDTTVTVNTGITGTGTTHAIAGGTDFGTLTNATILIAKGETVGTITIPITDDSDFEGNETFTVTISGPTITGGATQTVTINDNDLGISNAITLDTDGDGKIDAYKVVFSEAVTDSTFQQNLWAIAGYSEISISTGGGAASAATAAGDGSDSANDNIIYLRFTEGASTDTGAKPDLTTTAIHAITAASGNNLPIVTSTGTNGVTEQDGAKAIIVSAIGTAGSTSLAVTFSEAVYTNTGATGNITTGDTTFTDGNSASGATGVSSLSEADGSDKVITYTVNTNLVIGDSADSISYANGTVYDTANLPVATTAKTLTVNPNTTPVLTLLEELDTDHDGRIDTLQLTFDMGMSDASISGNLGQCTVGGYAVTGFNTGTSSNDNIVKLTVSGSIASGTEFKQAIYNGSTWQSGGGGTLATFDYSAHNGSGVPRDVAGPAIVSATASDATTQISGVDSDDILTIGFSENITAGGQSAVNNTNISSYINLPAGVTWPSVSSVTWTDAKTMVIHFSGTGSIGDGSLITAVGSASFNLPDAVGNYASSSSTLVGSFTTDTTPPYLTLVTDITTTGQNTLYIKFSEAVTGATTIGNYTLVNASTLAVVNLTGATVTQVSGDTYKLILASGVTLSSGTEYKLTCSTGIKDLVNLALTYPKEQTFIANDALRILTATMPSTTTVKVTFSRLLYDVSATCSDASSCAAKYYITPSIGNISSASVSDNVVTLTLDGSGTPRGILYTVIAANGYTSDDPTGAPGTFDTSADGSTGALKDSDGSGGAGAKTLSGNPKDRFSFTGTGTVVNGFDDGWYMDDPFADGSVFSFTFNYKEKVYVGPNLYNNTTLRFDADGKNIVGNTYGFQSSVTCPSTSGFGYGVISDSINNCDIDGTGPKYSGPKYEIGLVGYTSVTLSSKEVLFVGPLRKNASDVYYTEDIDNKLDIKNFNAPSFTGGANTQSIQTFFSDGTNLYIGYAIDHGTQAPTILKITPSPTDSLALPPPTGVNLGIASDNSTKAIIGSNASGRAVSGGTSDPIGVDSMILFNGKVYIANSGGIMHSSTIITATAANQINDYTNATPSGFTGQTLYLPGIKSGSATAEGLGKVSPGQRGIPFLKAHNSKLYLARNISVGASGADLSITALNKTPSYAELWVCTPGADNICQVGEWAKLFTTCSTGGNTPAGCTSAFGNDSKAISMFEINPQGVMYLGFDSPSGFRVFRNSFASNEDITASGWTQEGPSGSKDGVGTCDNNPSGEVCYTHIQSSTNLLNNGTTYYTYITAGKYDTTNLWSVPIKVFRQGDEGTARVVFGNIFNDGNLLAFISKTRKNVPVTLLFGIILAAVVGIGLRRKFLHDHHLI